jgi:diguanylate cyclase (GGDEF)-like protein
MQTRGAVEIEPWKLSAEANSLVSLFARAYRTQMEDPHFVVEALDELRGRLGYDAAWLLGADSNAVAGTLPLPPDPALLSLARRARTGGDSIAEAVDTRQVLAVPARDGRHVLLLCAKATNGACGEDAHTFARAVTDAVTARVNAEQGDIASLVATLDPLTLLPNRTAFAERLHRALKTVERDGTRAALMYVDLDGFKGINDGHGHATGDIVLAELAHRLRDLVRRSEFVARLGGDEFAVIVEPLAGIEAIDEVARRVLDALSTPVIADGVSYNVTASVGVALAPDDASTIDALLRCSDEAMYRAKAVGGGRVHVFGNEVRSGVEKRTRIVSDLDDEALEREFLLCYQPIVDTRSGLLVAAEALPRWRHPKYGLLTASMIFASLGASRLVELIDAWVIAEARAEAARFAAAGLPVVVHVNVASADQRVLATVGDGENVAIEVGETMVTKNLDASVAFFDAARERGFQVGIDQFGSSPLRLRDLARYNVDFVKIDPSMLGAQGITAAVGVTRAFGWKAIATGVPDVHHLRELAVAGIAQAQGYRIGAPMTAGDFISWGLEAAGYAAELSEAETGT